MPIYEYRCNSCAYLFDALQKVSDTPLTECPECGALELRRLVSAPSFRLKGGGWYETDFKSEKERKRNLADRGEAGGHSPKSDTPSDKGDAGKAAKSDTGGAKAGDKDGKSRNDHSEHRSKREAGDKRSQPEAGRKKGKGTDNAVA